MSKWKDGKPPEAKECNRCHKTKRYMKDFYHFGRERKDGSMAWYAIQPCIECMGERDRRKAPEDHKPHPLHKKNMSNREREKRKRSKREYHREYQRMKKKLETGQTMGARKRVQTRRLQLNSEPFLQWVEDITRVDNMSLEDLCQSAGVPMKRVTEARQRGYVMVDIVEKFFLAVGQVEMLRVMYDSGENPEGRVVRL